MIHFPGTDYGPLELRSLLRGILTRRERLVGWAPITLRDGLMTQLDHIGLALTPGVGPILAAVLGRQQRRFMIVTDKRMIVLLANRVGAGPYRQGVTLEAPLASLRIRREGESGVYYLTALEGGVETGFVIVEPGRHAHRRLREALDLLASTGDEPAVANHPA